MQEEVGLQLTVTSEWGKSIFDYPWYRTHVRVHMNINGLDLRFHIAMSPILPDIPVVDWSDDLGQLFSSLKEEVAEEMLVGTIGLFAMYISAKILSLSAKAVQPWLMAAAIVTMLIKFGIQSYFLLSDFKNKVKMLASCIVNLMLALLAVCNIDVVKLFLKNLGIGISVGALFMFDVINKVFKPIRDFIDIMEVIGDVIFFILSGIRFSQL